VSRPKGVGGWVRGWTQGCWVRVRTQAIWVRTPDPTEGGPYPDPTCRLADPQAWVGPEAGPIQLGS